jgi:hypothetical protein
MKFFSFTLLLATLTLGLAGTGHAQYGACVGNNSKACRDARDAFARHHGGVYPQQYYNQWYQGRQGRWNNNNNDWRWEGMDGDDYWRGNNGWAWGHRRHHHDHDDN